MKHEHPNPLGCDGRPRFKLGIIRIFSLLFRMTNPGRFAWGGVVAVVCLAGCNQAPARLEQPGFDAHAISDALLEAHDADRDGLLSKEELRHCPSILKAIEKFDSGGDGKVSREEIAARVAFWSEGRVAVMRFEPLVTLDGKPLAGARIELVPETGLAATIKPASGVSSRSGYVELLIAPGDLPPDTPYKGLNMGLYKVKVTHPNREIPAKYNTETELGQEVARDLGYEVTIDLESSRPTPEREEGDDR